MIVKTTCKCNDRPGTWDSIERDWQIKHEEMMKELHRQGMLNDIIKLLQSHQQQWFTQSLNIGSGAFWANKSQTTQQLINEIRGLK